MESILTLPIESKTGRVLQITDTHLFGNKDDELLGINTYKSFNCVIKHIKRQARQYDLILATGDLTQDQSVASYQLFAEFISTLSTPCVWLPGNHDNYAKMSDTFAQYYPTFLPHNVILLGERWLIVLLNSQVKGKAHGYLSEQELEKLSHVLKLYPNRQTIISLHHHSILSQCSWLDQHCLKNAEEFWSLVSKYPQIKTVLCGHIHQALNEYVSGVNVLATPSTCIQFKPKSKDFALDLQSPGWCEFLFSEQGDVQHQIYRVDNNEFIPNFEIRGY